MEVHCYATLRCAKFCWPLLSRAKDAAIVNITSRLGSISAVASGEYDHLDISYSMRISKAAQNMLSACLHREALRDEISVLAVHPGRMQTKMGNPDADLTAEEAAERFFRWLPGVLANGKYEFLEPESPELDW